MIMWARIERGIVVELTDLDPEGRFHPDLVWTPCTSDVAVGWLLQATGFAAPFITVDDQVAAARHWRDSEILRSEWIVARHRDEKDMGLTTTLSATQFKELQVFRQQLRDWPTALVFPSVSSRPLAPSWLAELTQ